MSKPIYAGFWSRVGMALVDFCCSAATWWAAFRLNGWIGDSASDSVAALLTLIAVRTAGWLSFECWLVRRYGGTFGVLLFGCRVVTEEGGPLTWTGAWLRQVPTIVGLGIQSFGWLKLYWLDNLTGMGGLIVIILVPLLFWFAGQSVAVLDILAVALNSRRRAIHDYVAGSFVVAATEAGSSLQSGPSPAQDARPSDQA